MYARAIHSEMRAAFPLGMQPIPLGTPCQLSELVGRLTNECSVRWEDLLLFASERQCHSDPGDSQSKLVSVEPL